MHAIPRRTLAGLVLFAAPALATAQAPTSVFGAAVREVASGYAGLAATSGPTYSLLASHDCATLGAAAGCSPTNNIQQGNGTWNYAPFNSQAGLPTNNFTGSVATAAFTTTAATTHFSFDFALLFDPRSLVVNTLPNNRDFVTMRLFQGSPGAGTLIGGVLFQLAGTALSNASVSATSLGGTALIPGLPATLGLTASTATPGTDANAFMRRTNWVSTPGLGVALGAGSYTFEVAVVDQNSKDNVAGVALDNVRLQAVVPEPATVALLGAGLLAVGAAARRRRA